MNDLFVFGFTGTRRGMTDRQKRALRARLQAMAETGDVELHHGDCVGADSEAHAIALELGIAVVIHPCTLTDQRAYCQSAKTVLPAKPPLERNRDIVDACELLIAAPATSSEQLRSGTWATVRYARKVGKRGVILEP